MSHCALIRCGLLGLALAASAGCAGRPAETPSDPADRPVTSSPIPDDEPMPTSPTSRRIETH